MKRFLKPLLGILAMGAALQPASATDYYLCGQRSYSVSDSQTFGIFRFDTTSGNSSMTQVKELLSDPTAGGVKNRRPLLCLFRDAGRLWRRLLYVCL